MKAIVYDKYGPPEVLHLAEVFKPVPKENEILVKVYATTATYGDTAARYFSRMNSKTFNMPYALLIISKLTFGLGKPKIRILGNEFAGVVEAVGADVTRYQAGDAVYGYRGQKMGTYAEYVCMPENGVMAKLPVNMTYEEAAAVPNGAIVALNVLKKITVKPGQKVLINGASGGIGSAALQLVKSRGAEVTGTCNSARMNYVKALGADKVIDYTKEDFTSGKETYDLVIDVLGRCPFSHAKKVLNEGGTCLYTSFKTGKLLQMLATKIAGDKKAVCALAIEKPGDLVEMKNLIESGKFRSIIARSFPLDKAAEAHKYLESGQAPGKIAIRVIEKAGEKPASRR